MEMVCTCFTDVLFAVLRTILDCRICHYKTDHTTDTVQYKITFHKMLPF